MPSEGAQLLAGTSPKARAATPGGTPGEHLARFWELRGRKLFWRAGVCWGHHRGPFFTSLPFQLRLDLAADEIQEIFHSTRIPGLSFPTDGPGLASGHYVLQPAGYDLASVGRKQRTHVTRGLEACTFRQLDAADLLRWGLPLNQDTLARQARADAAFLDPCQWAKLTQAIGQTPGMAIHGAFAGGKLLTYLISCREGEWLHLLFKMSSSASREHFPGHALDFSIIQEAAAEGGIRFIGNGCASVLPNVGLDRYKRQLGYTLLPRNLALHFHPWLGILNRPATAALARRGSGWLPGSANLAYAARILSGAAASRAQPRA